MPKPPRLDRPRRRAAPLKFLRDPSQRSHAPRLHADGLSYRKITAALAAQGHVTGSAKAITACADGIRSHWWMTAPLGYNF